MASGFNYVAYPYRHVADQDAAEPAHHAVIVAGGGLVGLTFAVDMAVRGHDVLVLDDNDRVSVGSRSICVAKRSLEIFDRLGIGARCAEKGVVWNTGKVLHGDRLLYAFDLLPEKGHRFPAFVNLQQYYVETFLIERFAELGRGELRWKNKVVGVETGEDRVTVTVETPDGPYTMTCDWLVAADGVKSSVRNALGLTFEGESFHDHFLITDVVMHSDMPVERRFWFDPPFHGGKSALLHKQPDNIWRIDLQLGPDADREAEMREEAIVPRLKAMLGPETAFTIDWSSLYTFQCRRMERFHHGRVVFVGDAAHTVSPFGARGGNGGIQDADNLAWKLAAIMEGRAGETLLETYEAERVPAADENILNSTRATDFIAPKNAAMELFREAVLGLADHHAFARAFVNSGRLSVAHKCAASPLASPDEGVFAGGVAPGWPALDAPLGNNWLLEKLGGDFVLLLVGHDPVAFAGLPLRLLALEAGDDRDGLIASRYDLATPGAYLFRPDQHVAARFRHPTPEGVRAALDRAMGQMQ